MSGAVNAATRLTTNSRKRTKTFTGCWTCRARKIKCDERKPSCQQCIEKEVHCSGYNSRLQWLRPETIDATGQLANKDGDPVVPCSLRRDIPPEVPKCILSCKQLDKIIRSLDIIAPDHEFGQSNAVEAVIHNFGVFSVDLQGVESLPAPGVSDWSADNLPCRKEDGNEVYPTSPVSPRAHSALPSPAAFNEGLYDFDSCNVEYDHQSLPAPNETDTVPSNDDGDDSSSLVLSYQNLSTPNTVTFGDDYCSVVYYIERASWPMTRLNLPRPLEPQIVPRGERFLMDHYRNRVVNLFCVIDNRKSPWKTIHLPLVLQSAGEQSFGVETTKIRDALRFALYAISGFYLANEHKTEIRGNEANYWNKIASQYQGKAIKLLAAALKYDLYGQHRPRYKEFLATMLSMITINVMSGDTSTCSMHLDGAEQLIKHMGTLKSTFSRKARSLHRIYLYLRVIFESTAPRSKSRCKPRVLPPLELFGVETTHSLKDSMQQSSLSSIEGPTHIIPTPNFSQPDQTEDQYWTTEVVAYECIYGIPQALLLMLKEAVDVVDTVDKEHRNGNFELSETLAGICENLENKILDWSFVAPSHGPNDSTNSSIIYHQTKAFHNALIVYFAQNVRQLGYRYQRQYVTEILESIEAIENIKAETNILAAPLFWPAFIGATEAFEPALQHRFRNWYDATSVYGLAAVRTGIQVIREIWDQGPRNGRQLNCAWREIIEKGQHTLMLT